MAGTETFLVYWTNPATGLLSSVVCHSREEVEEYVAAKERKYGTVRGYVRPTVEVLDG